MLNAKSGVNSLHYTTMSTKKKMGITADSRYILLMSLFKTGVNGSWYTTYVKSRIGGKLHTSTKKIMRAAACLLYTDDGLQKNQE